MDFSSLIAAAVAARNSAYAPYSKFQVGAALLTESGEVFSGCNVENASYGLTNCAERTAVFKAVSEGHTKFTAIAISVPGAGSPCGACRQVLNEFNPQLKVIITDGAGNNIRETSVDELLPEAFGPGNLSPSSTPPQS
ncbi:MAG: cytidine deaminase [Akkermansiaceae bacterium]